jgi:hypothetical protein
MVSQNAGEPLMCPPRVCLPGEAGVLRAHGGGQAASLEGGLGMGLLDPADPAPGAHLVVDGERELVALDAVAYP